MCWAIIKNLLFKRRKEEPDDVILPDKIERNWRGPEDTFEWRPIKVEADGIIVKWREKYGCAMEEKCVGLWINKNESMYMLTWKDGRKIFLQKENIVSIGVV